MNQENLLNKIRQKDAKAFTHGGKFHADDIFSSAESASRCFAEQRGAVFLMYENQYVRSFHFVGILCHFFYVPFYIAQIPEFYGTF